VECVGGEEEPGQEPDVPARHPGGDPVRQVDSESPDQGAHDAREEEHRGRAATRHVLLEVPSGRPARREGEVEFIEVLEPEREVEAQRRPSARVRVRIEPLRASPPKRPGPSHGRAVRLLDDGVVEDVDLERGVGKPIVDSP